MPDTLLSESLPQAPTPELLATLLEKGDGWDLHCYALKWFETENKAFTARVLEIGDDECREYYAKKWEL